MQSNNFCLILNETSFLNKMVFILLVSLVTSSVYKNRFLAYVGLTYKLKS